MPRRAGRFTVALAAVALSLLGAGCSQGPGSSAPTTSTTRATTTTTVGPAGAWSKPIPIAANANLSVVSCPAPSSCVIGSTVGQTYRLFLDKVSSLGSPVPSPAPQGVAYLS